MFINMLCIYASFWFMLKAFFSKNHCLYSWGFPKLYILTRSFKFYICIRSSQRGWRVMMLYMYFVLTDFDFKLKIYLCRLATSYAAVINRPYAYALSLCLRPVSFAIQKG
jgi:hypothetical protein